MYLVYDAQEEVAYWVWVQEYLQGLERPSWRGQGSVTIRVPLANVLDADAVWEIEAFVNAWWDRAMAAPMIASPFNLPADLGDFTGREAEVAAVRGQLLDEGAINITSGMGGIGKTALAVHVAQGLAGEGRFQDAQFYIDLLGTRAAADGGGGGAGGADRALAGAGPAADAGRGGTDGPVAGGAAREGCGGDPGQCGGGGAGAAAAAGGWVVPVLVTSRRRFALPGAKRLDLRRMAEEDARALLRGLADAAERGGGGGDCRGRAGACRWRCGWRGIIWG